MKCGTLSRKSIIGFGKARRLMSLSDVNRHGGRNELRLSITVRELMKRVHEHILMIRGADHPAKKRIDEARI